LIHDQDRTRQRVATLYVIKGADEGKRFDLSAPVIGVGRDTGNAIRLHDTEVSRRHAEFRQVNGTTWLTDLGSSNGTYVNNQPVREAALQPGDHITVGQTILVYHAAPVEGSPSGTDLAKKISMISQTEIEIPSAIVKTVSDEEGSRLLAKPEDAGPWLRDALANLSVMYQAAQATSHILDTDQLLEKILDLLFQSITADRGCILLRQPQTGEYEPRAVRFRAGGDQGEKISISRTIIQHVLQAQQGVLVSDASQDARFAPAQSIVKFGIREAICVPMRGRHETVGVMYLDTRTTPQQVIASSSESGKLSEDHLKLAIAIGHQAALAVEETRYHQAMVQAERLAAVGQTIAAISHHVKNILQGLRSGSDLIKLGLAEKNSDLVQQGWRAVEKNQGRIYELVMDMLSYSKEREPALQPTDINALVEDVLEVVTGRINEMGVRVSRRLAVGLPAVQVDPEAIHRVLLNLVTNGLDALEGRENPLLSLSTALESDGEWVRIGVTENGVGIPAERVTELFKPFVSTKGTKGTGLGLAVSRKIAREHGGDILVQSQVGKGSRFVIRLPVHSPMHPDYTSAIDITVPDFDKPPSSHKGSRK
jgi:C4-dicarboxylate-specific signal transduction histidine kinase